ncbi:MAG: alpha-glucosidase [Ruminococcaceae bacterium]|nr:alpha-glucosidase [Oscillospiraceae bacterium]
MIKKWWHDKIAYQIYPKSFCDLDGDGIGDIKGIISKLDYLKSLGIDIVWLSPVYKSPFVDQGYDISDYYSIAEEFGTMEEFDTLLAEMKKRDMHLIMDLVVNHCSDQHEWFKKAVADPYGEYAQRFYFRKGVNGREPSNYRAYFGGNVWTKVPGQDDLYYLHFFTREQPDLNWENPVVREKIYKMVNWWLDKGLSGFRIDAIINIKKNTDFPVMEPDDDDGLIYCEKTLENVDGIGDFLQELKHETFDRHNAFTVGEVFAMPPDQLREFVGPEGHFSTMFDFAPHSTMSGDKGWYDGKEFNFDVWRDTLYESQLKMLNVGFLANIIENHDQARGVCRYLPGYALNDMGKKMLAAVMMTLRGIPFIYQGQEIGMENCPFDSVDEFDDVYTLDQYNAALEAGFTETQALKICNRRSRDNARTPMQWSDSDNAGFSTGTPWLKVNPNYKTINVAAQEKDKNSVLNFYRRIVALRKNDLYRETFTYGGFVPLFKEKEGILAFCRSCGETCCKIVTVANFGKNEAVLTMPYKIKKVLISNSTKTNHTTDSITLSSCECAVLLCE